jgi:hypothetical protein
MDIPSDRTFGSGSMLSKRPVVFGLLLAALFVLILAGLLISPLFSCVGGGLAGMGLAGWRHLRRDHRRQ